MKTQAERDASRTIAGPGVFHVSSAPWKHREGADRQSVGPGTREGVEHEPSLVPRDLSRSLMVNPLEKCQHNNIQLRTGSHVCWQFRVSRCDSREHCWEKKTGHRLERGAGALLCCGYRLCDQRRRRCGHTSTGDVKRICLTQFHSAKDSGWSPVDSEKGAVQSAEDAKDDF